MVVETAIVSVVTKVVLSDAGQSVTDDGQAVMVAVLVVKTVEVVNAGGVAVEDGDDPPGAEEGIDELDESSVVEDCTGSDEEVADGTADEGVADGITDDGTDDDGGADGLAKGDDDGTDTGI